MKIKITLFLLMICFASTVLSHEQISVHEKYTEFKSVANKEIEQIFDDYFKSVSFRFNPSSHKVDIHVKVNDDFFTLSKLEQFTHFDMSYQKIRLYLKYKKLPNPFWEYNLQFYVDGKNSLVYDNTKCYKKLIDYSCGVLTIDQNEKVIKSDLRKDKQLLNDYQNTRTHNGVLEKKVIEYYEDFFNMLTRGRVYYRVDKDEQLAMEAVMAMFHIDLEEFKRIYYKYYVLLK